MQAKYSQQITCYGIDMRHHFLAIHPLIGTKYKPSPLSQQQRSPYYWWWAYLKRNQSYIKCCENGGKGKLSKLYKDFSDTRADDFPSWWGRTTQRGQHLFSEQLAEVKVLKLNDVSEWDSDWNEADVMVVAVNMQIGKRKLQQMFSNLLAREHKGQRGRKALAKANSTARYPLYRNFSRYNLQTMLKVYDAWLTNSKLGKDERKPLWKVGEDIKLLHSAITIPSDTPHVKTAKQNIMTATVSRHVKNAKAIIANTAKGEFPNSTVA